MLVNGAYMPFCEVAPWRYRLRILNASNFRPYNVYLSNGETLTQITGNPTVTFLEAPAANALPLPDATQTASTLVDPTTGESYESVLVTLTNVKVNALGTEANFGVGELQQGATPFLSDDDVLRLDDPVNTCYATVTGIWTYQVFDDKYGLLPISTTVAADQNDCN